MASLTATSADSGFGLPNRHRVPGAGSVVVANQSVLPVRCRVDEADQADCTVHLVPMPRASRAGEISAVCGALLWLDEIERADPGDAMSCSACTAAVTRIPDGPTDPSPASSGGADAELVDAATYQRWGWPVTQRRDLVKLDMDGEASAIAIPVPLCTEVTRILVARHCAPAVLAHPYAGEHHMVLTGERFGALLPWPPEVYQVNCSLMLPPTKTLCGPITWVHPPSRDSLRLSREIDVFGALRTVLGG